MTATPQRKSEASTRRLRAVESDEASRCRASDGAEASLVDGDEGDDALVVHNGEGQILFEYHAATSRCVVHQPTGDLVLRAPSGAIALEAAEGLQLRGGPVIDIEADLLRASTDDLEVTSAEVTFVADVVTSTARRLRQRIDLLETTAGRIVERAGETYRDVERLAQTRAGRVRIVAKKTFHVLGERTLLKATKDVKLKGEKIYLG